MLSSDHHNSGGSGGRPVIIDFGFANRWDLSSLSSSKEEEEVRVGNGEKRKEAFMSDLAWGCAHSFRCLRFDDSANIKLQRICQ